MDARAARVGLGLAGAALLAGCARAGGEPAQFTANGGLAVDGSHTISQTVNPAGDQVKGIDLLVLAVPREGDGNLNVALAADGEVLAEHAVPLADLGDADQWVPFSFDEPVQVPDVVDVQLRVNGEGTVLIAANSTPMDVDPNNEPTHDPYPQGEGWADGTPINGDIAFRVVGTAGPSGVVGQVGSIIKEGIKRLTAQPLFAALWVGGLAVALGLAVWGFTSRKRG